MKRIDADYHVGNLFQSGNPLTGQRGTRVDHTWLNAVQEELVGVIEGAGIVIDPNDNGQLWKAICNIAFPNFAFLAEALAVNGTALLPSDVKTVWIRGHSVDGIGGAQYCRVATEPAHKGKFQDVTGQWWELNECRPTPQMFGARADGVTDDSDALQASIDYVTVAPRRALYLPGGTYIVSRRIFETSNGGRLTIFGDGKDHSIIKAAPGLMNTTLLHLGNSNHHGAYQAQIFNLGFHGNDRADGNIGLMLHEGGISHLFDVKALNCAVGISGPATTGLLIDGKCLVSHCTRGIVLDRTRPGVPVDLFDTTYSQIKGSPSNIVTVRNCWIAACDQGIYIDGGAPEVSNCTFQRCGISGSEHVVHVYDNGSSGSASKFAGAKIWGNWFEGGEYKYAIHVENLRNSVVRENHIIGSSSNLAGIEGGILIDAPDCTVAENSIYRFFKRPVSDGRVDNAAIYFTSLASETCSVRGNGLTRTQTGNQYYFEGNPNPTVSQDVSRQSFAYFTCPIEADPVLQSGRGFRSATRLADGYYSLILDFARDSYDTPTYVTVHTTDDTTPIFATCRNVNTQSIRVSVFNNAGTRVAPIAFSVIVYGNDGTK